MKFLKVYITGKKFILGGKIQISLIYFKHFPSLAPHVKHFA